MNCTVDEVNLDVCEVEDRNGWLCASCNGVWLPADFLASFGKTDPWFIEDFYERLTINIVARSQRRCPEGHGGMDKANFGKIELDWCHNCEGVWFDKGELEAVVSLASLDAKGSNSHAGEYWPVTVLKAISGFLPA